MRKQGTTGDFDCVAATNESVPQRLKPRCRDWMYGTAEAVPLTRQVCMAEAVPLSGFTIDVPGSRKSRFPSGTTTRKVRVTGYSKFDSALTRQDLIRGFQELYVLRQQIFPSQQIPGCTCFRTPKHSRFARWHSNLCKCVGALLWTPGFGFNEGAGDCVCSDHGCRIEFRCGDGESWSGGA